VVIEITAGLPGWSGRHPMQTLGRDLGVMGGPMAEQSKHRTSSRTLITAVAVFLGTLVAVEPFVLDTKPGLQIVPAGIVVWFWALFMLPGRSDRLRNRE
jgi:hypothetical protein